MIIRTDDVSLVSSETKNINKVGLDMSSHLGKSQATTTVDNIRTGDVTPQFPRIPLTNRQPMEVSTLVNAHLSLGIGPTPFSCGHRVARHHLSTSFHRDPFIHI